ncbi:MAG: hypothetical protein E7671_05570 [Ruminococcaceae bacterium]|nr:hypothetical protein [Oscillospiraceae bacterium]
MRNVERKRVTVASSNGVVNGERICYKLIKREEKYPIYRIHICIGREHIERSISTDIREAAVFYDRIVKNLVTPITFDDVIEDFFGKVYAKK